MTTQIKWLFFLPILPYLVALAVTNNLFTALAAIAFYPAGIALILAVKNKQSRTATIISVSAILAVCYILYITSAVFIMYGAVNAETLKSFWLEATNPLRQSYSELTMIVDGQEVRYYSDKEIENLITNITVYIPAAIISAANIIAFIISMLYHGLAKLFRIRRYLVPSPQWKLTMSVVSAYIYCGVYLIVIFTGGSIMSTITAVTANVLVILTPGFSYMGVKSVIRRFKSERGRKVAIALIVLTAVFLFLSPSMIFYIASLLGVVETFIDYYTIKRLDK